MSSYREEPILKEYHLNGWLKKLGGPFQTWKKRYFELDKGHLLVYKVDPSDSKPKGAIDLSLATGVSQDPTQPEKFYIICSNRTWTLMSDSPHETYQWIQDLSDLLKSDESNENMEVQDALLTAPSLPNVSLFDDTESSLVDIESQRLEELEVFESHRNARESEVLEKQREREEKEMIRQQKSKEKEEERKKKTEERQKKIEEENIKREEMLKNDVSDFNDSNSERLKFNTPVKRAFATPPSPDTPHISDMDAVYSSLLQKFFDLQNEHKKKTTERQSLEANIAKTEALVNEKMKYIEHMESGLQGVQSLKEKHQELLSSIQMLVGTHERYSEQKKYHEDLTNQIYNDYKETLKKTEKLDYDILEKEDEISNLESKLSESDLKVSQLMSKKVKSKIGDEDDLQTAIEFQSESLTSLKYQYQMLEKEMQENNERYDEEIKSKSLVIDNIASQSDHLRFKIQQLRSKSVLQDEVIEEHHLQNMEKEYFTALVNGIKLAIIREGHVVQVTSSSDLYDIALEQKVDKNEWPRWISSFVRNRIVKDENAEEQSLERSSTTRPPSRKIKQKRRRVAVTGIGFNNFIAEV